MSNTITKCYFDENNLLHSTDDQPAIIITDLHGYVLERRWYKHGDLDRSFDRPAIIIYHPKIKFVFRKCEWYRNGEHWRVNNGPIIVEYADVDYLKLIVSKVYYVSDYSA